MSLLTVTATAALLELSFTLNNSFRSIQKNLLIVHEWNCFLIRLEIVACDISRIRSAGLNLARRKTRSSTGTFVWIQCFNSSSESHTNLKYRKIKKHSASKSEVTLDWQGCGENFPVSNHFVQKKSGPRFEKEIGAEKDISIYQGGERYQRKPSRWITIKN